MIEICRFVFFSGIDHYVLYTVMHFFPAALLWKYDIIASKYLYLEKNGVFRKGRNFHSFCFPIQMLEPVICTQVHGFYIHMVTNVIIKR